MWSSDLPAALPGKYYIALGTASKLGGPFSLMADVDGAFIDLTADLPAAIAAPADFEVGDFSVFPDGHQYRFTVPADATSLYVRFQAAPVTNTGLLALRYDAPSIFTDAGLPADATVLAAAGGFQEECYTGTAVIPGAVLYLWVLSESLEVLRGELSVSVSGCTRPLPIGEDVADVARAMLYGARQLVLTVPDEPAEMTLTATLPPEELGTLTFYLRQGLPVEETPQGLLLYDIEASATGEFPADILLDCPLLAPGAKWYILVANTSAVPIPYTLKATPVAVPCSGGATQFTRGNANADGALNIADAVTVLGSLFGGGTTTLTCIDAADGNDDGLINIADAVKVLGHLFAQTGPLAPPFGACGVDPTQDTLECEAFTPCP